MKKNESNKFKVNNFLLFKLLSLTKTLPINSHYKILKSPNDACKTIFFSLKELFVQLGVAH